MNIFFVLKKTTAKDSPLELVTAPLDRGDVLPGVTRDSILELCRTNPGLREQLKGFSDVPMEVNERWVNMPELVQAEKEGRVSATVPPIKILFFSYNSIAYSHHIVCFMPCDQLVESFGAGTAAIVSPVSAIGYCGRDIQIPVGSDSAAVAGRTNSSSVADLVRSKILDIQVSDQYSLTSDLLITSV